MSKLKLWASKPAVVTFAGLVAILLGIMLIFLAYTPAQRILGCVLFLFGSISLTALIVLVPNNKRFKKSSSPMPPDIDENHIWVLIERTESMNLNKIRSDLGHSISHLLTLFPGKLGDIRYVLDTYTVCRKVLLEKKHMYPVIAIIKRSTWEDVQMRDELIALGARLVCVPGDVNPDALVPFFELAVKHYLYPHLYN